MTQFIREELRRAGVDRETVVTIGTFDGVHRGHQYLLGRLKEEAARRGLACAVITFHPVPRAVIRPQVPVFYITSLDERIDLLRRQGVDFVVPVTFTSDVANLSARQFVALLREEMRMRVLVVGPDFALGRGREGTPEVLADLGREEGFEVVVVPPLTHERERFSSTTVRKALAEGDMETVQEVLGRPFTLEGPVVRGQERGRLLGFPTANIAVGADRALPAFGVYVTRAWVDGKAYPAVTNIGRRPTFDNGAPTVETHILDFEGDLYGREICIELLSRIRGEQRFSGPEELRAQIQRDVEAARRKLA